VDRFEDLIERIVKGFNTAGTDYMFTGALASSYYGTIAMLEELKAPR